MPDDALPIPRASEAVINCIDGTDLWDYNW